MSKGELRQDPTTGNWVIVIANPEEWDFSQGVSEEPSSTSPDGCPFCPGNEGSTPPEILAYRDGGSRANQSGWRVRVVPNKFPVLHIEGALNRRGEGIYDAMDRIGAHEVIIETPRHEATLTSLSEGEIRDVLQAYQNRILDLKKDQRFRYISIFKNHGRAAGASIGHPHSQLIATPIIPRRVREELMGAKRYFDWKERCVWCDIVHQEWSQGLRVIEANSHFMAIAPFASRFPFEICILPRKHFHSFEEQSDTELPWLASIMKNTLRRLELKLGYLAYNMTIHSSPNVGAIKGKERAWSILEEDFHWHIEIIPRFARVSGFERGAGFNVNPLPPEQAAGLLKEIEI